MNEIFITIIIFITIGFFGVLNLTNLNDKLLLEKESQNIFNELSTLNTNFSKNTCFKMENNNFEVFDENDFKTLKNSKINSKISSTISTSKICCKDSLTCTPSTVTLNLKNYTCKIIISLRGQIRKICNKE